LSPDAKWKTYAPWLETQWHNRYVSLEAAREHLDLARKQWERAASDWWEPSDPASCVTNVFYAYENLIVAVAEVHGRKWERNHYRKAELAAELAKDGLIGKDLSNLVLKLNDLRKDVSYGEPGDELVDAELEEYVSELEEVIEEVKSIVDAAEEEELEEQ
jgi:uncharacterized protein YutE (UPF0331/DUF86 family)